MEKPQHHFFLCASFRANGDPQGSCFRKGGPDLLQYLENEILDRGIDGMVTSAGCMKVCEKGPVMVDYPAGNWYCDLNEERIDEILDAIEDGEPAEHLMIG